LLKHDHLLRWKICCGPNYMVGIQHNEAVSRHDTDSMEPSFASPYSAPVHQITKCSTTSHKPRDVLQALPLKADTVPAVATGLWAGWSGVRSPEQTILFSSLKRTNLLRGPYSVLFNGYRGSSWRQTGRGVKLTTHLHLVPKLRMSEAMPLHPPSLVNSL
jgi:hypothetical protein